MSENNNEKQRRTLRDLDEAVLKKNREMHEAKANEKQKSSERTTLDYSERVKRYQADKKIIQENRRNREKNDINNLFKKRKAVTIGIGVIGLILLFIIMQLVMPGSLFRRNKMKGLGTASASDADEKTSALIKDTLKPKRDYSDADESNEQLRLWNLLMKHYDGNTNAVLGVMCNLYSESHFEASNLEDYNNDIWAVDDFTYTDSINSGEISKQDFLEARTYDMTNGYYNDYYQWVNVDGGYGYAQVTAYIKKEELYQFAEQWFGPKGEGENYRFDIGDPDMQAHYLIHLLESEDFENLDSKLRSAETVVDACYYWLDIYEVPYDPYCDNYYTLAFERAECAEKIEAECIGKDGGE